MTNIAILGSNAHIARGLIRNLQNEKEVKLFLFSRNHTGVEKFLGYNDHNCSMAHYPNMYCYKFDMIINCVGVGTEKKDYTKYFTVLSKYDDMVMEYLSENPDCKYVFFSTGSIHRGIPKRVDSVGKTQYPAIVRLFLETKHRAHQELNIADLRIYSYFSRYINLEDNYLICDIIKAVKNKTVLKTSSMNIIRDYLHPNDLFGCVKKLLSQKKFNKAIEVGSAQPVRKFEIIKYFQKKYNLEYKIAKVESVATGNKDEYFPARPDNNPKYSSIRTIETEAEYIIGGRR